MPAIHSQVVESAGYFHRQIRKAFFGISENIFDNPITFDASNCVFYRYPRAGNQSIEPLVRRSQFFTLWIFWAELSARFWGHTLEIRYLFPKLRLQDT